MFVSFPILLLYPLFGFSTTDFYLLLFK